MEISVIIPTRNRAALVEQLLQDIQDQTLAPGEVIVVDQSEKPGNIRNCTYVHSKSLGPCIARNIGVQKARGAILVFLDDDARIEEDFIREITEPLTTGKSVAVAGAVCDMDGNYLKDKNQFLKRGDNFIKAITDNPDFPRSQFTLSFPAGCSAILKEVFLNLGGFDEEFDPTGAGEDRDMALNLFSNGYPIWYNSNARLLHIGAESGGSREVGSRSENLDVHTYLICKKYFSEEMARNLKETILANYRKKVLKGIFNVTGFRTRIRQYFRIKHSLN